MGAHLALGAAGEAQVNPVQLAVVEAHDVRPVLRTAPRSGFEGSGFGVRGLCRSRLESYHTAPRWSSGVVPVGRSPRLRRGHA